MNEQLQAFPADAFTFVSQAENSSETLVRPGITFLQDAWRRLKKNKVAIGGLIVIVLMVLLCILGPHMTKYSYDTNDLQGINISPNGEHWFGTDLLGRDMWARVWTGTRVSLIVGFVGSVIPMVVGVILGGISGYVGGRFDMFLMRLIDIVMCIPNLIFVTLIMLVMGPGLMPIIVAVSITGWLGTARITRSFVMQLKTREFVLAARALGTTPSKILLKHLIPNLSGYIVVWMSMDIPLVIFQEAYLSFIGLGIQSPLTSLGQLAEAGGQVYQDYPYQLLVPSMVIILLMLAFNLFGDGLRDALDPTLRNS